VSGLERGEFPIGDYQGWPPAAGLPGRPPAAFHRRQIVPWVPLGDVSAGQSQPAGAGNCRPVSSSSAISPLTWPRCSCLDQGQQQGPSPGPGFWLTLDGLRPIVGKGRLAWPMGSLSLAEISSSWHLPGLGPSWWLGRCSRPAMATAAGLLGGQRGASGWVCR